MIRLSIIVPFYGVEKYIEECIRSLYDQDIPQEEYEVICVDDCSPDGSLGKIEELRAKNGWINLTILRHTENKRQGGARNTGLKAAKGEYIWFVDSDDYVMPNSMGRLLRCGYDGDADIVTFGYTSVYDNVLGISNERDSVILMKGEDYVFKLDNHRWYDKLIGPWRQIIRRCFLQDNNIQFVENVQYEDTDYLMRMYLMANKVVCLSDTYYFYRKNESSTTAKLTPIKLIWMLDQLERCASLIEIAQMDCSREKIKRMVTDSASQMRLIVKRFSSKERNLYRFKGKKTWPHIKKFVNWRTWLAIKYGITRFV